uniref:Secreted protein n=1 Tax=Ditylenchus dipsaci TaxID=166011 RepID=A0A915DJ99_9BILA
MLIRSIAAFLIIWQAIQEEMTSGNRRRHHYPSGMKEVSSYVEHKKLLTGKNKRYHSRRMRQSVTFRVKSSLLQRPTIFQLDPMR